LTAGTDAGLTDPFGGIWGCLARKLGDCAAVVFQILSVTAAVGGYAVGQQDEAGFAVERRADRRRL